MEVPALQNENSLAFLKDEIPGLVFKKSHNLKLSFKSQEGQRG